MKKLILLQATSDGVSRTIRANYYKQSGANALRNDGLIAPFVLQLHYDKIETTRKLRPIKKEESE